MNDFDREKPFNQRLERIKQIYFYLFTKRIMDIIISFICIIIFSPLVLICIILIKLDSRGPCFYMQGRVGINGKCFTIYKLRTMYVDAEKNGPQFAKENDSRITRVGSFFRKTRIDELPQFLNVIKGEMSIVGPRPERPCFVERFDKLIPCYRDRSKVKPGITGWAQINGAYWSNAQEKLVMDLYYIKNMSVFFDINIMIKTLKIVIKGTGAL